MNDNINTTEFSLASRFWLPPEPGEELHRDTMLRHFDIIASANSSNGYGNQTKELSDAYTKSVNFVNRAFDVYEGLEESPQFDWAFAVPGRGDGFQGEEYASEVTPFLPILSPEFGVNSFIRQRVVSHLAPSVIETYKGNQGGVRGALVWSPIYFNPKAKTDRLVARDSVIEARLRMDQVASFARQALGAKVMGLGAVIPGLTNLGKTIKEPGLETTTGHGGTVYLVTETVHKVAELLNQEVSVGILGLGAIGGSSLNVLQNKPSIGAVSSFGVYDKVGHRQKVALELANNNSIPTIGHSNERDLIDHSDIIVSAITDTLNLDALEQAARRAGVSDWRINLRGKVIIDDSQPGSFNRDQVEARGGKLVWVVGQEADQSEGIFERVGGYNYGNAAGLMGARAVWGCEAEAGAIAMLGQSSLAVKEKVTPQIANNIGRLLHRVGVGVAQPLQSFGKRVDI